MSAMRRIWTWLRWQWADLARGLAPDDTPGVCEVCRVHVPAGAGDRYAGHVWCDEHAAEERAALAW